MMLLKMMQGESVEAITEMLNNYDKAIKDEHSIRFFYGSFSVNVIDSPFLLSKINTKFIWTHRRYHMDKR